MENNKHIQSKILTGVFVIFFGVMYLLSRSGFTIPHWILSWKSIMIVAGLITLYKHNFRHFFGYILIFVGGFFMINEFRPGTIDSGLFLPILIISIGVMILAKATNFFGMSKNSGEHIPDVILGGDAEISSSDFIKTTTIFGGTEKNVVSKDFKGADLTTVFGGCEINLTQADIQHPVVIQSLSAFGGLEIIVPSNWTVKSEITAIFGGVEDKRSNSIKEGGDPEKVLILRGTALFGGVEVHSYV